MGTYRR